MAPEKRTGWAAAATFLISAVVVLATYGVWILKTYQGAPVNPLVVVIALVITIAGAGVVFGRKRLSGAFDMVSEARGMAEEMRRLKEQQEAQRRFDELSDDAPDSSDDG